MAVRSAIAGLVVVRIQHDCGGVFWEWTYHARTSDGSANSVAKMNGLAAAVASTYNGDAPGLLNDDNAFTGVAVQDLSSTLLPDSIVTAATSGTRGASSVPQSSCIVVTKRSDFVGRAFRGRAYISGGVTGDLAASPTEWTSGYASDAENAVENVRTAMPGATPTGYLAMIYHRKAGKGGIPAADTTTPATASLGRTEIAQQRSRRS